MLYKNKNYAKKTLPDFQDGDIIDGGNYAQVVVTDVSANLTIRNFPNMENINLTGDITEESSRRSIQMDNCYWLHLNDGLENYPTYSGAGATCGPDVVNCRHVDQDAVVIIESDDGDVTNIDDARKDTVL